MRQKKILKAINALNHSRKSVSELVSLLSCSIILTYQDRIKIIKKTLNQQIKKKINMPQNVEIILN